MQSEIKVKLKKEKRTRCGYRRRAIKCGLTCFLKLALLCTLAVWAGSEFHATMAQYNTVCCFDCVLDLGNCVVTSGGMSSGVDMFVC